MARKKTSPIEDLFEIAALLPWWAGVGIAVVVYFVCHSFATAEIAVATKPGDFGQFIGQTIVRTIASFAQYVMPIILLVGAAASAIRRSAAPQVALTKKVDATRWSAALLGVLEWKRFEEVCAGLFERLGFTTKSSECGADSGIDIHLYRPPSDQPVAIVQCKAWTKKVGVNVIRELRGVMSSEGVAEGICVTSSGYSDDAIAFAKANQIDLMDGDKVLKAILKLTEEQQASLLRLATAGDYTTPTCPSCGVKMEAKKGRVSGKPFWGCVNYPKCKTKLYVAGA